MPGSGPPPIRRLTSDPTVDVGGNCAQGTDCSARPVSAAGQIARFGDWDSCPNEDRREDDHDGHTCCSGFAGGADHDDHHWVPGVRRRKRPALLLVRRQRTRMVRRARSAVPAVCGHRLRSGVDVHRQAGAGGLDDGVDHEQRPQPVSTAADGLDLAADNGGEMLDLVGQRIGPLQLHR